MAFYVINSTLAIKDPPGWSCTGIFGADGGITVQIGGPTSQASWLFISNGFWPSVAIACPYFAPARPLRPCTGAKFAIPATETVNHVSASEVLLDVPARTKSTVEPVNSPLPVRSSALWLTRNRLRGIDAKHDFGYAVEAGCDLASAQPSICNTALAFMTNWYSNPANAGF